MTQKKSIISREDVKQALQQDDDFLRPLVILQRRNDHVRLPCVSVVHGAAVVTEGPLGKPLWIAAFRRTLGPGITIGVERDTVDPEPNTALLKLRRPISRTHPSKIGKQGTRLRQRTKDPLHVPPEPNLGRLGSPARS